MKKQIINTPFGIATLESSKGIGKLVVCDICNEDYSHSDEKGGFVFGGSGYCPKCAVNGLKRIKGYNEEKFIKAFCPDNMSYKDFILEYRKRIGTGNLINIYKLK